MKYCLFIVAILLFFACEEPQKAPTKGNPPAKGFNSVHSDAKAVAIADEVMIAMGGRENYDQTRFIQFNFFGSRVHTWDKLTGDIRIDYQKEDKTLLMNIHTMEGKAMLGDTLIDKNNPQITALTQAGKAHWINDTYWLVMPFKLKDSGVTLKLSLIHI